MIFWQKLVTNIKGISIIEVQHVGWLKFLQIPFNELFSKIAQKGLKQFL